MKLLHNFEFFDQTFEQKRALYFYFAFLVIIIDKQNLTPYNDTINCLQTFR